MRRKTILAGVAVAFLFGALTLTAHSNPGSILGVVQDASGALVPDVAVSAGSISMRMEGIQEARVQVVNRAAEFGSVGIYQMVTKSGGNQLHGTGYYHLTGYFEEEARDEWE